MTIELGEHRVIERTHLYFCHILDAQYMTKLIGLDNHVAKLLWRLQTASIFHGVFILLVRLLTKLTRGSLDILLCKGIDDI